MCCFQIQMCGSNQIVYFTKAEEMSIYITTFWYILDNMIARYGIHIRAIWFLWIYQKKERNIIFTMKSTFIHQYSLNRFLLKNVFCNVTFHLYLNYSYKTWNVFNYEILRFSGFPLWEKIWYVIQLSDKTSYGKDMSVECIHFSKSISVSSSLVNVFKSMTVIWSLLLLEW